MQQHKKHVEVSRTATHLVDVLFVHADPPALTVCLAACLVEGGVTSLDL